VSTLFKLLVSNINLHYRVAAKKSGPTIENFLKKIEQQMGVAIVGVAAFRDERGKLCTFEYVNILYISFFIFVE
jgi:hypothetical protein